MRAARDSRDNNFRIKKLCDTHRCERTLKTKMAKAKDLAKHFRKRVHEKPFYKVIDLIADAQKEFNLQVKWGKCVRAKNMIVEELEGNFKEEYGQVLAYDKYLEKVNPNNTVKVKCTRAGEGEPLKFQRMYFGLGVLKEGWKKGCRPVIGIDGCFLKGVCKGV